jgi:DNA-binding GntR family transcriptional regulator
MRFYSRDIKIQVETDEQWAALAALRSGDGATARRAIEADIRAGGVFLLEVGEFDDTSEQL